MKQIKQIETPEKIILAKIEKKEVVICDLCNMELKQLRRCCKCGRDICEKHLIRDYPFGSDNPDYYCVYCDELFNKKYIDDFEAIEKEYYEKLEQFEYKIVKESLSIKNDCIIK